MQAAGNKKTTYLDHFGFDKRPFGAAASGRGVFVGPHAARMIADFRKGIGKNDAVVTIAGGKGSGKTTLVNRALDSLGIKYKTIRVGRLKMNSSEVLESLLVVLGVRNRPAGTMQRFAALRKTLKEHQDRDVRIFIVVEDAVRTGTEALAEIEAMTAANAGESDGATIVVMGNEKLADFLEDASLAELRNRITQRQSLLPMSAAELRGYLIHSFRHAGADFQRIFDATSIDFLYQLSGGIARLANRVVEASMVVAAGNGLHKISAALVATVARDRLGLSVDGLEFSASAVGESPAIGAGSNSSAAETVPAASAAANASQSRVELAPDARPQSADSDEIPALIQDTQADQKALTPAAAANRSTGGNDGAAAKPPAAAQKVPEPDFAATIIPQLTPDLEIIPPQESDHEPTLKLDAEPPTEIVPELEYEDDDMATMVPTPGLMADPLDNGLIQDTAAQLAAEPSAPEFQPDFDALEQAMAVDGSAGETTGTAATNPNPDDVPAEFAGDGAQEPSINMHLLDTFDESLEGTESKADVELDQVAADIANPESLADVDDRLAETLFGSEFRCLTDEEILAMQRADADEETPPDEPAGAAQPRSTVIPVAREAAVDNLVSANDEDSGEAKDSGPKISK